MTLIGFLQISQQGLTIFGKNLRPQWQIKNSIRPAAPGAVAAHAVGAAFGFEMLLEAEVDEGVQAFVDAHDHAAAIAAVTAIGAAAGNILLPAEANAARPRRRRL